jgi:hypothetical protein
MPCSKSNKLTPIYLSMCVEAVLNRQPSNEVLSFRPGGDGKGARGIGGETSQLA